MPTKRVISEDRYEQGGKQFVTLKTDDGWLYRFSRLTDDEPYTFDMKQKPDGTRPDRATQTPDPVKEYLRERVDVANLDPEPKRNFDRRDFD